MTREAKIDLILKALYDIVKENNGKGALYPVLFFRENGFDLTEEELKFLIIIMKSNDLIVTQTSRNGTRIFPDSLGKFSRFVESTSYSSPGVPIVDL